MTSITPLIVELEDLEEKLKRGEISTEEHFDKEDEILAKIEKIVSKMDFNGGILLNEEKVTVTLTINEEKANLAVTSDEEQ